MSQEDMLQTIREEYHVTSDRVLAAMAVVDREDFVPPDWKHAAYHDRALPIGYEQTISQPYIVAYMTELLDPQPTDRVLEIGAGSGYQTAILAKLAAHVYAVEIVGPLVERAREVLDALEITNVSLKHDDGVEAWLEEAPFDRILMACAPPELPEHLKAQLADGGRLVYPAGNANEQFLYSMERHGNEWTTEKKFGVRFVPMTSDVR